MQDQLICWVSKARFPLFSVVFFSCRPMKTAKNYVIGEMFL